MAKYIAPSPMKGSNGGATFQRCGKVFAIRKHNVPTDKKRLKQFTCRNLFEHVQGRWRNLSPIEQASFAAETINYLRVNSIGDIYEMLPINLQNGSNTNLINAALPPISSMPLPVILPAFTIATLQVDISLTAFDVITDPNPVPDDFALFIYASAPMSPGNNGANNIFKLLAIIPENLNTSDFNHYVAYRAQHGELYNKLDAQINVTLRYLSYSTGQFGPSVQGSTLIVP